MLNRIHGSERWPLVLDPHKAVEYFSGYSPHALDPHAQVKSHTDALAFAVNTSQLQALYSYELCPEMMLIH